MEDQGIASPEVFHQWLEEERVYLSSLVKEPMQETLEMEYYQRLVNFHAASYVFSLLFYFHNANTFSVQNLLEYRAHGTPTTQMPPPLPLRKHQVPSGSLTQKLDFDTHEKV